MCETEAVEHCIDTVENVCETKNFQECWEEDEEDCKYVILLKQFYNFEYLYEILNNDHQIWFCDNLYTFLSLVVCF